MSLQAPLWRSIAVYRGASLAYAAFLLVVERSNYEHLAWAWLVLAAMAAWTLASTIAYAVPAHRNWPVLATDLVLTIAALLSTAGLQFPASVRHAAMPVTATWIAGPVLAWAVAWGSRAGAFAGALLGICDLSLRHQSLTTAYRSTSLNASVLLLLAGIVVGYVSRLVTEAEQALQRATELEAASAERDRLARHIHDSVLQMLALVQRRGAEAGGEAAELGRLAGEQEAALRRLIAADDETEVPTGERDLRALLGQQAGATVSVVTPGEPVLLADTVAHETAAAVRAALDNVRRHCGPAAKAWVLVDDVGSAVNITVRDEGPGMPDGRLAQAAAEGRLGVSQAICGRIRDLGGSARVTSAPGAGTEVRLRVPRRPNLA